MHFSSKNMQGGLYMITHVIKVKKNGKDSLWVAGNYPKEVIHAKDECLLHTTVLILVVRKPKQNSDEYKFILCNKAPKVLKLPIEFETDKIYWDTAGGHCEDFPVNSEFTDEMWLSTAKRELSEEVLVNENPAIANGNFRPLCKIEYGPADMPDGGKNHEVSQVYVYEVEENDKVILQDDYNVNGCTVTRRFATSEFSYSQLIHEYKKSPKAFMDGIGRIIEYLISNFSTIFYLDSNGNEVSSEMNKMPQKCGECPYKSSRETFSHYDDLEGFDVYHNEIICKVNDMTLENYRSEGSLRYDYGHEERTLEKKPTKCPLYQKFPF
jgi:hypothetical protein